MPPLRRLSPEEQRADVERHIAWFRRHGEHVIGGEELDEPARVKALRPGRQGEGVVVTDGRAPPAGVRPRIGKRWHHDCMVPRMELVVVLIVLGMGLMLERTARADVRARIVNHRRRD